MNFFKKISVFILTVALSLSLFSFKSTNSNERNLGMSQVAYNSNFTVANGGVTPDERYTQYIRAVVSGVVASIVNTIVSAFMHTAFTPEQERNEVDTQYHIENL